MAKDLEWVNGGCGTKMVDLEKRLKECRDNRVNPNKNMEESNKRSLLIQSEAVANTNNVARRPPTNPP